MLYVTCPECGSKVVCPTCYCQACGERLNGAAYFVSRGEAKIFGAPPLVPDAGTFRDPKANLTPNVSANKQGQRGGSSSSNLHLLRSLLFSRARKPQL